MSAAVLGLVILVLFYVLVKSTDVLVVGLRQLARGTKLEAFGLTAFLVALATSLPELFVSVAGALEGSPRLSLGLVLGSNIANISLVLGGAALLVGKVKAADRIYKRDLLYAFLIASLPLVLLIDGVLSRLDGVVLLLVYGLFNVTELGKRGEKLAKKVGEEYYEEDGLKHKILKILGRKEVEQGLGRIALGSILLVVASDLLVRFSQQLAEIAHIPVILIGLFMISIGTSLPELVFEIRVIAKREYLMAFGNIIGSTVANSSLILGLVSLLSPIHLGESAKVYLVSVIAYAIMFFTFWFFVWTKRTLARWEGLVLVGLYLVFAFVQLRLVL